MNRGLSFLGGLIQALVSHLLGIGLVLLITTAGWLIESGASADWYLGLKVAGYLWFLIHGVPINFEPGEILNITHQGFLVDVVPLGGAILLLFLALSYGRRISELESLWPAWLGLVLGYAALSVGVNQLIVTPGIALEDWRVLLQPALAFGIPAILGSLLSQPFRTSRVVANVGARGGHQGQREASERMAFSRWRSEGLRKLHWGVSAVLPVAARVAVSSLLTLAVVSASVIAVMLALNWVQVIALYESMQISVLGGIVITIGQLLLLPNFILFGMSWIAGAGFAIGAGSWVSPLVTELGPLPNLPFFAAIPVDPWSGSVFFVVIPMLLAFTLTVASTRYLDEVRWEFATRGGAALALASVSTVLTMLLAFVAAELASGSIAPGRLEMLGVQGWQFALAVGLEVGLGTLLGALLVAAPNHSSSYSQRR